MPNLPLGCSANHRFSSDPALTYSFKPLGGRIYLIYLCSIRAAEHQSGGLLCTSSAPFPSQHFRASVPECCCQRDLSSQTQLAKAQQDLPTPHQITNGTKGQVLSWQGQMQRGLYQQESASSCQEKTQPRDRAGWWQSHTGLTWQEEMECCRGAAAVCQQGISRPLPVA